LKAPENEGGDSGSGVVAIVPDGPQSSGGHAIPDDETDEKSDSYAMAGGENQDLSGLDWFGGGP